MHARAHTHSRARDHTRTDRTTHRFENARAHARSKGETELITCAGYNAAAYRINSKNRYFLLFVSKQTKLFQKYKLMIKCETNSIKTDIFSCLSPSSRGETDLTRRFVAHMPAYVLEREVR